MTRPATRPRRFIGLFLSFLLAFSLFPAQALAEENGTATGVLYDTLYWSEEEPQEAADEEDGVTEAEVGTSEASSAEDGTAAEDAEQTDGQDAEGPANPDADDTPVPAADDPDTPEAEPQDPADQTTDETPVAADVEPEALVAEEEEEADIAVQSGEEESAADEGDEEQVEAFVSYTAYIAGNGWATRVSDGSGVGNAQKNKRIEAIRVKFDAGTTGVSGGIEYRVNYQGKGWTSWRRDNKTAGVADGGKRVEALQLRLYGGAAKKYDVYYAVATQAHGWMATVKNGEATGTAGLKLRMNALRIALVKKGEAAPAWSADTKTAFDGGDLIAVKAKVQSKGWMTAVGSGEVAGTTGKSKRLEGLNVVATGLSAPGSFEICGNVQSKGWTAWAKDKVLAGKGKRLEAVRIRLTGEAKKLYDVYYSVHVSHLGWLGWAKNGAKAGTAGMSAKAEAVRVKLVPKGSKTPSNSGIDVKTAYLTGTKLRASAHCQKYGWRKEVGEGKVAGTTGKSKRLEALKLRLTGGTVGGGVSYSAYVSGSWQGWKSNGAVAGTTGKSKAVGAIKVKLTGRAAKMYDVYYRVHVNHFGWLGWAKNGEVAGSTVSTYTMQAYQVRLVPKGQKAPGSTKRHEINREYIDAMITDRYTARAQGYSSSTGWLILVDTTDCWLTVYTGSQGNWHRYNYWRVSCGKPSTPSVRGVFHVSSRGTYFQNGDHRCWWWTSWNGPYLFHSVIYEASTNTVIDGRLGYHISAGCVRMWIDRAKWIHDTIPTGTTVVVF